MTRPNPGDKVVMLVPCRRRNGVVRHRRGARGVIYDRSPPRPGLYGVRFGPADNWLCKRRDFRMVP